MDDVTLTDTKIRYRFQFDKALVNKCKHIGMRWSPQKRDWYIDRNKMNERLFDEHLAAENPLFYHKSLPESMLYNQHEALMEHQKRNVWRATVNRRWLFADDTGTGKTLSAIEIIKAYGAKTLVICPLSIIEPAWMEDLLKFDKELAERSVNLWKIWKSKDKKIFLDKFIQNYQVSIVNFETFKIIQRYLETVNFDMVIIDESSKIKNYKSDITKNITAFCDNIDYTYLFSGTPAPNNKLEYFSQARIIDPTIFGKSYYKFRAKYYDSFGYGGYTWVPKLDMEEEFNNKIAMFSSTVRKEDVLDLPERTDNVLDVHLTDKEKKAYREMAKTMAIEWEGIEIVAANAAVKGMKLRELTSGFVYDEDKVPTKFGDSKFKVLQNLLEEIGDRQVIIWTQFNYEAEQIAARLSKLRQSFAIVNGKVSQIDKEINIAAFKQGEVQYMLAHPKSLGHGHTLVNCTYIVYFSISYSFEEDYQSRDRIYRKGQTKPCTYYYLLVPNSIDTIIYKDSAGESSQKGSVAQEVFNHVKMVHKGWK